MENTVENKAKFFAQYWGQEVLSDFTNKGKRCLYSIVVSNFYNIEKSDVYLELKPLSQITDEDAIEVAKIVHQIYSDKWEVIKLVDSSIHVELKGKVNDVYHISIGFRECSINANHHFLKTEDDTAKSFKINIGQVNMSSSKPIGYVYVIDYLRSKGYAMPYMDLSVENMIEYGWVKITNL